MSSFIISSLSALFFFSGMLALGGWPNDTLIWFLLVFSSALFGLSILLLAFTNVRLQGFLRQ